MAVDIKRLTRDWIQFLKNNQIVSGTSDPSGKLQYKKKVTADNLSHFLDTKTDFDEETINKVIQSVLSNKAPAPPSAGEPAPKQSKKYSNDDAEDVPYRDIPKNAPVANEPPRLPAPQSVAPVPQPDERQDAPTPEQPANRPQKRSDTDNAIRKRNARSPGGNAFSQMQQHLAPTKKRRGKPVTEDITDEVSPELGEKDVEAIFKLLASSQPAAAATPEPSSAPQIAGPETSAAQPNPAEISKLKRIVRDKMSPAQRKALWRALNESFIFEAQIEPSDINAVFKDAYKLRDASTQGIKGAVNTGLGKINKGLQKNKIELADLQQAWKDAGYPDDTRDISKILKDYGFGDKEVNKIFSQVFGDEIDHGSETVSSSAATEIAAYAKKHNLKDALVAFMEQEFGEELGIEQKKGMFSRMFGKKATTEDIRQIFTSILQEERTMRDVLIKEQGFRLLGRNRK